MAYNEMWAVPERELEPIDCWGIPGVDYKYIPAQNENEEDEQDDAV